MRWLTSGAAIPNFEVLVLNDRSTDATGEILDRLSAQDSKLVALNGAPLPTGWWVSAGRCTRLQREPAEPGCFSWTRTPIIGPRCSPRRSSSLRVADSICSVSTASGGGTFWERALLPVIFWCHHRGWRTLLEVNIEGAALQRPTASSCSLSEKRLNEWAVTSQCAMKSWTTLQWRVE